MSDPGLSDFNFVESPDGESADEDVAEFATSRGSWVTCCSEDSCSAEVKQFRSYSQSTCTSTEFSSCETLDEDLADEVPEDETSDFSLPPCANSRLRRWSDEEDSDTASVISLGEDEDEVGEMGCVLPPGVHLPLNAMSPTQTMSFMPLGFWSTEHMSSAVVDFPSVSRRRGSRGGRCRRQREQCGKFAN